MKNLLVIDDNPDIRTMVASMLTRAGYVVRQATNGREGIQMVINQKPSLIICDIDMPELNGYVTLEAIRKCSGTAAIPFIFMTGSSDVRRGMASGADDYLRKPFSPGELIEAVKSRLTRQTDIQTEFLTRSEIQRREELRELSSELLAPLNGFLSLLAANMQPNAYPRETNKYAAQPDQPVFSLD